MSKNTSSRQSRTDLCRLDRMQDEEIDFSDIPEVPPEMFAGGVIRNGLGPLPPRTKVTLRLDADVLRWFRKRGRGYQTQINALLRAYMVAHRKRATPHKESVYEKRP